MKPLSLSLPTPANRSSQTTFVRRRTNVRASGFTLIELLTVIAIIAILTAIILPVFGMVRENTRRATCQSNMQKISSAVKQYELDNRRFPEYLFGPAIDNATGLPLTGAGTARPLELLAGDIGAQYSSTTAPAERTRLRNVKLTFAQGLYPEYISDLSTFHCPNNTDADTTTENPPQIAVVQRFSPAGKTMAGAKTSMAFYKFDSYDANPSFNANGALQTTFQARYARQWQPSNSAFTNLSPTDQAIYKNQLVFSAPSTDSYLTMCTYHAPKGKLVVSWLGAAPKTVDTNKVRNDSTLAGTSGNDFDMYKFTPNK